MYKHQTIAVALFLCNTFFSSTFACEVKLECSDRDVILTNEVARQFEQIDRCLDAADFSILDNGRIPLSFPNIHSSDIHRLEMFVTGYQPVGQYQFGSFTDLRDCLNAAEQLEAPEHVRNALEKRFFTRCSVDPISEQDKSNEVVLHGRSVTVDTIKKRFAYYKDTPAHDLISLIPTYQINSREQLLHDFYIAQSVNAASEIKSGLAYRLLNQYKEYYNIKEHAKEKEELKQYCLPNCRDSRLQIINEHSKNFFGRDVTQTHIVSYPAFKVLDGLEKILKRSDAAQWVTVLNFAVNHLQYAEIARIRAAFPRIKKIDLYNNQITHLTASDVAAMEGIEVNLSYNKITSIEQYPRYNPFRSPHTKIDLRNNPLTAQALQNIQDSLNLNLFEQLHCTTMEKIQDTAKSHGPLVSSLAFLAVIPLTVWPAIPISETLAVSISLQNWIPKNMEWPLFNTLYLATTLPFTGRLFYVQWEKETFVTKPNHPWPIYFDHSVEKLKKIEQEEMKRKRLTVAHSIGALKALKTNLF